jgi:hypothetical protein
VSAERRGAFAALLALGLVAAAPPPSRPDPGLEPADVVDQYRAWAASKHRKGDATELVCRPFAEGAQLCFTHAVGGARTWFTKADGKDAAALEAEGRGTAEEAMARLEAVPVEGFTRSYWLSAKGDGRDHVPVLFPDALDAKLGGPAVVAAPARGVLVAWLPGDLDFDKAVAVGVRRMYETLPDPVSPLIWRWDGKAWKTWGEAKAVDAAPPPPAGGADGTHP